MTLEGIACLHEEKSNREEKDMSKKKKQYGCVRAGGVLREERGKEPKYGRARADVLTVIKKEKRGGYERKSLKWFEKVGEGLVRHRRQGKVGNYTRHREKGKKGRQRARNRRERGAPFCLKERRAWEKI